MEILLTEYDIWLERLALTIESYPNFEVVHLSVSGNKKERNYCSKRQHHM